jgi:hypothetical protein
MRADEIVAALEEPLDDHRAIIDVLRERASDRALAKALRMAQDPLTRRMIGDVVGLRAGPALPAALDDREGSKRASAANALDEVSLGW